MYRRSYRHLAALSLLALASGCVQMTRHSNTMVFGTNTTVGLKVGQDPNQVPEVVIGYDRQEAVIMPLLANTSEEFGDLLSPCRPVASRSIDENGVVTEEMLDEASAKELITACKFVASRADEGGLAIADSYSVLASFGAQIEGTATDGKGSVGLAQYFATGVAAQILAATGGAALVAVGEAAEKSAANADKANAVAAVLGADAIPSDLAESFDSNVDELKAKLRETVGDANRSRKVAALYGKLTPKSAFAGNTSSECAKGLEECIAAIDGDSSYLVSTGASLTEALKSWSSY